MMDEGSVEVITPEEAEARVREQLAGVYAGLSKRRDEWVRHRAQSGVETRWRKAQAMYDGQDPDAPAGSLEDTLTNGPRVRGRANEANRSRVVVNIVAPKVDAAVARVCEILLPVDDRNWGMKPTPDPRLSEDTKSEAIIADPQTGQQAPLSEAAKAKLAAVKKAAEGMELAVDDVLTECGYNGQQRKMIFDAVRLGTGIIKGPVPMRQVGRRYGQGPQGGFQKVVVETIQPASKWVPPWQVFTDPACGPDHQRGSGILERRPVTPKELRALKGIPGYDDEAIDQVLAEKPRRITVAEGKLLREQCEAYELWEYHGEIEPEEFGLLAERTGLYGEDAQPKRVESAVLIMVNDRVIGALEPWWEDDLPYDFFVWQPDEETPFGLGLPHRLETQQRVVTAAWRQLMDNAGAAAGAQIVINKALLAPANGKFELEGRKLWFAREEIDDVRKAFNVFEFPSRIEELLKIVEVAMQFADQESMVPTLMQGDPGSAPDTVGGQVLLLNNANSPLRYRVKLFDDNVTRPHLKRYYDWMMQRHPDDSIKGDFEVDARGSSTLIERDMANQAMANVANLAQHPIFGPLIEMKAPEALREILKSYKVDPDRFVPNEDELRAKAEAEAAQPPPADPRIEAAQIAAQSKKEEIADRKEERAFRAEVEAQNAEERRAQIAYNSSREQGEFEIAMTQEQNERYLALIRLQQERELTQAEMAQKRELELLSIDSKRQLFNAEALLKTQQGSGI